MHLLNVNCYASHYLYKWLPSSLNHVFYQASMFQQVVAQRHPVTLCYHKIWPTLHQVISCRLFCAVPSFEPLLPHWSRGNKLQQFFYIEKKWIIFIHEYVFENALKMQWVGSGHSELMVCDRLPCLNCFMGIAYCHTHCLLICAHFGHVLSLVIQMDDNEEAIYVASEDLCGFFFL